MTRRKGDGFSAVFWKNPSDSDPSPTYLDPVTGGLSLRRFRPWLGAWREARFRPTTTVRRGNGRLALSRPSVDRRHGGREDDPAQAKQWVFLAHLRHQGATVQVVGESVELSPQHEQATAHRGQDLIDHATGARHDRQVPADPAQHGREVFVVHADAPQRARLNPHQRRVEAYQVHGHAPDPGLPN
jgi:hypothetical protein